jgi:beta-1,4-N-acetylglucosaminyltransferase
MILVTVGAAFYPFDRLLRAIDELEFDDELLVQHGTSTVRPRGATCVDFLPFEALAGHMRTARAVITHGGIGSILVALANDQRPLAVPRLRRYGEAVDDHQVTSVRALHEAGLVTAVEDPARLAAAVVESSAAMPRPMAGDGQLAAEIRAYLSGLVRQRASAASAG